MKLANNLYTLVTLDENNSSATIALCPDSVIYKAHFPEQPITPGVCIIQVATEVLESLMNKSFELSEIKNAKFLAVISPLNMSEVTYTFQKTTVDEEDHSVKTNVVVSSGETVCAKLSLRFNII